MTPVPAPEELEAERLRKALHLLAELAEVVATSTELQPILDWIVQRTTALLAADEGCLRLVEAGTPGSRTLIRPPSRQPGSGHWPPVVATSVTGCLLRAGEPIVTADLLADERFPGLRGCETRVRALLAVPLRVENRITGILAVTHVAPGRRWSEDDVELLSIVAANSAGVIEQAHLRVEAEEKRKLKEEAERTERELGQARETQMRLVPDGPLRLGDWEIAGSVKPARQVGGDTFDYFVLGGRRLGFAIGDVSGKGMPAALLMMTAQGYLRVFCNSDRTVPEKLRLLNQSVTRSAQPGKFITLFYAELDPEAGRLCYVNAGHNYPLLRRADGSVETLVEGGLMLGFSEDVEFTVGETRLVPGDMLLLYSDGLSEAEGPGGAQYGEDRLREVWCRCGALPPGQCIVRLLADLESFRGTEPQSDDVTLVVLGAPAP